MRATVMTEHATPIAGRLAMAFVGLRGAPGFHLRPLHHAEFFPPDEAVGAVARALVALYVGAASVTESV